MPTISVRKGFQLRLKGRPPQRLNKAPPPAEVAVLPERLPFVKPKLVVKQGDAVRIGSVVFEDKRNRSLKFASPGGGRVKQIVYGPRRSVKAVVIALDADEKAESFHRFTPAEIDAVDRPDLVRAIVDGGLWGLFRELPFRDIPHMDAVPPAIIVHLDGKEPFQPPPSMYLEGRRHWFDYGLKVLKRLGPVVHVSAAADNDFVRREMKQYVTHWVEGPYPSQDPGVLLFHIRRAVHENHSWYIRGQDVLLLAELLKEGRYPTETVVALGGGMPAPVLIQSRLGAPFSGLVDPPPDPTQVRLIGGGAFRGIADDGVPYLGFYDRSVVALPLPRGGELFGFARAGADKPSMSGAFLSRWRSTPFAVDCDRHGDLRSCVNCGYCSRVCPVDILPQFTYKSVLAQEVEEALAHGLLDCVECGVCTFVCPSKIDLCLALKKAKTAYYKEVYDLKPRPA